MKINSSSGLFMAMISLSVWGCKSVDKVETTTDMKAMMWLTDPANNRLFERSQDFEQKTDTTALTIELDTSQTFQTMDGYGFTLTGGSAYHLSKMAEAPRKKLLEELFGDDDQSIRLNYLRLSVGASDLDFEPFSYSQTRDTLLENFDLGYDKQYLIPILKEILAINPKLKLMASPWSPPSWMKDNGDSRGGSLLPQYYDLYVTYLVKYIQAMATHGITIDALTVQNEPLHPGNNPSLLMLSEDQNVFVRDYLGPNFKKQKIKTKIIVYDHNADKIEYPINILNDKGTRQYVDGSAFHLYGGTIDRLSLVHQAHPDKHLYFSEQWTGAPGNLPEDLRWNIVNLVIGAPRNWCKTVLQWNLASDEKYEPHTDRGGCTECLGGITLKGDKVIRNPGYYNMAHGSRVVADGALRIASNYLEELPNVAFKNPDGSIALIVFNDSDQLQVFNIKWEEKVMTVQLEQKAAASFLLSS